MNESTSETWTKDIIGTTINYSNDSGVMVYNQTSSEVTDPSTLTRVFESPPLETQQIVTIPIYCLVFMLSVVGNLLVIITLIQNKRMRTVTNVFLLNLSISDLLLVVFCMPFTIIPTMLKNFIFGPVICVMIRYLQGKSIQVKILRVGWVGKYGKIPY